MWCDLMMSSVSRQKGNGNVVVREDVNGCGCVAPWCEGVDGCDGDESAEGLETGSADYGDVDGI